MVVLSYSSVVETASRLTDVDLFDTVDQSCIQPAMALLGRVGPIVDSVRIADLRRCEVPVEFNTDFFSQHMHDVQHLRDLARALRFASAVASFNEDYDAVAEYGIRLLELANATRRGGLIVDHLVASSISGHAVECLRLARYGFADTLRRELLIALVQNEREREPLSQIAQRDATWVAVSGYEDVGCEISEDSLIDPDSELSANDQREIFQLLKKMASEPDGERQIMHVNAERFALAETRLLTVDSALRCWKSHTGRYPNSIAELAPSILPVVPLDPFTDSNFIYRATTDAFSLYSTGPDQVDGGGRFAPRFVVSAGGYDLSLDAQDYWSDFFTSYHRRGIIRRLYSRLRFWR